MCNLPPSFLLHQLLCWTFHAIFFCPWKIVKSDEIKSSCVICSTGIGYILKKKLGTSEQWKTFSCRYHQTFKIPIVHDLTDFPSSCVNFISINLNYQLESLILHHLDFSHFSISNYFLCSNLRLASIVNVFIRISHNAGWAVANLIATDCPHTNAPDRICLYFSKVW